MKVCSIQSECKWTRCIGYLQKPLFRSHSFFGINCFRIRSDISLKLYQKKSSISHWRIILHFSREKIYSLLDSIFSTVNVVKLMFDWYSIPGNRDQRFDQDRKKLGLIFISLFSLQFLLVQMFLNNLMHGLGDLPDPSVKQSTTEPTEIKGLINQVNKVGMIEYVQQGRAI